MKIFIISNNFFEDTDIYEFFKPLPEEQTL